MSREIRRLHRKQTQFTNFTGSQATELPSSTESIEQNIADASGKPFRRRRRQRQDDSFAETNNIPSLLNSTESTEQNIRDDSEDTPLATPLVTDYYSNLNINDSNSIRAEIKEDIYHSKLADSDFSDDTHDWGGDLHEVSDDYWHFLGRYE